MMVLLAENGIKAKQQVEVKVFFYGQAVGKYFPDILVEDSIILELKSIEISNKYEKALTLNYLKATGLKLALILNFVIYFRVLSCLFVAKIYLIS